MVGNLECDVHFLPQKKMQKALEGIRVLGDDNGIRKMQITASYQLQGLYKLYVPWLDVEKIPNRSIDTQIHPFILHDEGSLREDLFKLKSLSFATIPALPLVNHFD